VQGCNFNCLYCQNPDTINCKGGRNISTEEIINLLEDQRPYFINGGGLTISGGEPLLQAKDLIPLFQTAKKKNFHTALDTNGSISTPEAKKLFDLTDLAIIDLKHFNSAEHKKLTGSGNEKVLEMIKYREDSGRPFWIRHVLVPGLTDQNENLEKMATYLKQFKNLQRFEILPYHNLGEYKYKELGKDYSLKNTKTPDQELISRVEKIFTNQNLPVFIRH
jgi:pyruvate formate lyase activating enzyme